MALGFGAGTVYVLGLGITGKGTAQGLRQAGVAVAAWDDGEAARREDWLRRDGIALLAPDRANWKGIEALVKSPGIPLGAPAVQAAKAAGVPVLGDIDLLWRREAAVPEAMRARFVGITGSNGKSTTTSLIGHVLKEAGYAVAVGGNLGTAVLQLPEVAPNAKGPGFYVLECSSYQLETVREAHFDSAVLLNLTPNHLERHGDMAGYLAAKRRIFAHGTAQDVRVVGVDQPILRKMAGGGFTTVSVGGEADIRVDAAGALWDGADKLADLAALENLAGPHNWQNIACAWAALKRWVGLDAFMAAARTFQPLPHRMERIGHRANVTFINDSKSTTGDSSARALEGLANVYWICGGRPKIGGLDACLDSLGSVQAAFTIGEAEEQFSAAIQSRDVPVFKCHTLENAVREAWQAARVGGKEAVVLLSPAAASQDQFKNFEHRGDVFTQLVRTLP
jgi:UDP-N-acetylmuramoylalanine--D-glutamate ligase